MTHITGGKQGGHKISWSDYLDYIIEIDRNINAVCIRLDEEGNFYLEMTPDEARVFAKKINQAVEELEK